MKKILVVDDSPTMRRMVISSLRGLAPARFEHAGSGLEAIEQLALFRFDIVILDLNMPDMHGLEVLDFMQKHQIYKNIPVVVLTTKSDEDTRAAAMNAGAALFTTKPYDPAVFSGQVKKILDTHYVRYE